MILIKKIFILLKDQIISLRKKEESKSILNANESVFNKINKVDVQNLIINHYIKKILEEKKKEYENQYTEELAKQKYYENNVDVRHSTTHLVILKNLQTIQSNIGILNTALSEIPNEDDLLTEKVNQQLGLQNIIAVSRVTKSKK